MESQKLWTSRRGHRSVVTRLFTKLEELQSQQTDNVVEISAVLDSLRNKQKLLQNLNSQILEFTDEEKMN